MMRHVYFLSIVALWSLTLVNQGVATPSDYDQYLLELINRGRANPAAEVTRYGLSDLNEGVPSENTITADAKPPLAFNEVLISAAQQHSQWMLDNATFSHTGDGGSHPQDRMETAGYVFTPSFGNAENIGWTGTTGILDQMQAVEDVHENLFVDTDYPDRGHRVNLMNPDLREVGNGVKFGVFTSGSDYNAAMVSEDFAYSADSGNGNPFITGIVWNDIIVADGFYTPGGEGLSNITITATDQQSLQEYTTSTWSSGGYSLPVPSGTYDVTAAGSGLVGIAITNDLVVSTENVKIDFTPAQANPDAEVTVLCFDYIVDGDSAPSRLVGTDFGSAGQSAPGPRRIFMVRNDGGAPLVAGSLRLPSGYILEEGLNSVIAVGGQDSFTVRLDTDLAGTWSGDIDFTTNDPDEGIYNFVITGRVNPSGSGISLIQPIGDVLGATNMAPVTIDLQRHFDEIGIDGTVVLMPSELGGFYIEMTDYVTPVTVDNFLNYVADGDYVDSFIHRSVPGFVIQGGGFQNPGEVGNPVAVPTDAPVTNEFSNWFDASYGGLSSNTPINVRGTLSMAKTGDSPDSATSQFFVNLNDNSANLDAQNGGFTVFAEVLYDGMDVIDVIAALPIYNAGPPFDNLPLRDFAGGSIYKTNLVTFTSPAVVPELVFTIVSNDNPGLVSADIDGDGCLALSYNSGVTGVATITIRATDLGGNQVEDTFQMALEDGDGDGFSDYDEFVADTDASDSNDWFAISSIEDFTIRFPSSDARQYTLLFSTNLAEGSWSAVSGQEDIMGSGGEDFLIDYSATNPACFYRVQVELP